MEAASDDELDAPAAAMAAGAVRLHQVWEPYLDTNFPAESVLLLPKIDLEHAPVVLTFETDPVTKAFLQLFARRIKEFFRWRRGWREQRPEVWINRITDGKQPWGVIEGSDATGSKWELGVPRDHYVGQYRAVIEKYCPTGEWHDELYSFEYGHRSRLIPLHKLFVLVDTWIRHMGGYTGRPDRKQQRALPLR
jgi:hypothetical protein